MSHTVQLNASDARIEFAGDADKAHEVARRISESDTTWFARHGYSVMDERGRIEAVYRAGLRWKFRDADGLWVELPLFDAPETVIERSPVVEW